MLSGVEEIGKVMAIEGGHKKPKVEEVMTKIKTTKHVVSVKVIQEIVAVIQQDGEGAGVSINAIHGD